MPKFSNTETLIKDLFKENSCFNFENQKWTVLECAKPRPSRGECKTDIYLLVKSDKETKEIKISIKQDNADFLENKIKYERAKEIFGKDVDFILINSINSIKKAFVDQFIVYFNRHKRTKEIVIKLGWKFELMNKKSGDLSGELILTDKQREDIYSGINLPSDKKNASVNGRIIENSGVAEYIMVVNQNTDYTLQYCIDNMQPIKQYICGRKIFFACKALNYRLTDSKWDGNRPLAVYINWFISNKKLKAELIFNEPLKHTGNEIGNNVKELLGQLNITKDNFNVLKNKLDKKVKII